MAFIEQWRTQLTDSLTACRNAIKAAGPAVVGIDPKYGVFAAGLLWPVRQAGSNIDQRDGIRDVCGSDEAAGPILENIRNWPDYVTAARELSDGVKGNLGLQIALEKVLTYFQESLLSAEFVTIDIRNSTVQGAIVNIGGKQFFYGDVTITLLKEVIRVCPTAPKPPAHFTGRRAELDQLKAILAQGQNATITGIQGMGGIGKTALAQQLCTEMSNLSAVLWASLGPNPSAMNELLAWAHHADPAFDPGNDDIDKLVYRVQALLTNLISDQCPGRALVVLDDVWEEESLRVARILQRAAPANSSSLITTRSQLVVAQLRSTRFELRPMKLEDAYLTLRKLLSAQPDIAEQDLRNLAEVVQYHPLALELAAGQVGLLERPALEIRQLIEEYRGSRH